MNYIKIFSQIIVSIGFLIFFFPLLKKYHIIIIQYVFSVKYEWNKKIDKPRIFFFIILTPIFYFNSLILIEYSVFLDFFILSNSLDYLKLTIYLLSLIVFVLIVLVSKYIWSKNFEVKLLPKIIGKVKIFNEVKHQIKIDDKKLDFIYFKLKQYDLIHLETLLIDFKTAITFIENEDIAVIFNMNGPDFKCFYELLDDHNTNKKLEFSSFLINNKMIVKANGKNYIYATLKDSKYNSSKNNKILKDIFKFKSTDY